MKRQRKIIILIKLCRPFEKLQSTMFNLNAVIPIYKKNKKVKRKKKQHTIFKLENN